MYGPLWIVPFFPLVGFLLNGLFGKWFDRVTVSVIACTSVGLSFLWSVVLFFRLSALPPESRFYVEKVFDWFVSGNFSAPMEFYLDPLSAVMILTVSGVGFLIHVYSHGYMSHDESYARYFSFLNLFTFAMLVLVLGSNLLVLFIGWEGVGLCSYLLIGFWFTKKSASDAGKKAFIVNRVGDFGFLLGTFLIFVTFGTLNIQEISTAAPNVLMYGGAIVTTITLLLFVGATGKSAQIPLYIWLPDAMEGPTPVSALIHAATMVTAGVYMVARMSALYVLAPVSMTVVAVIGAATAIFAATIAITQFDIKRVLAYSTISQLGYMFLACGVGAFSAGIFHLMTHAFFKALLFMCAGSVMHAMSNEQDMRYMGDLRKRTPKTFYTMLIGTLAIAGIPGLSGFFSKDEILWESFASPAGGVGFWVVGAVAAGITAFYMFRLIFMTFFGQPRYKHGVEKHIHESPNVMTYPLIALAILAIIGGYVGIPHVLGGHNNFGEFLKPSIAHLASHGEAHHSTTEELLLMGASVAIALLGIVAAFRMYIANPKLPVVIADNFKKVYNLLYNKYYVDEIYYFIIVKPFVRFSQLLYDVADRIFIDGSINLLAYFTGWTGEVIKWFQTGYVRNYIVTFVFGLVIIVGYMLLK
ncbi:MAG: NADH-quinone oxidoreductase subunit L [candidate division Zixibacteria bacterium]|nr:NADH-quinone oxidoreductase subunit L [candidate division Zixibacteria bacterium]